MAKTSVTFSSVFFTTSQMDYDVTHMTS